MLTGSDGFSILEPFDPHEGVADRVKLSLEMSIFSLHDFAQVGERLDEGGLDRGRFLDGDGALVPGLVLQVADLLQRLGVLSLALNQGALWEHVGNEGELIKIPCFSESNMRKKEEKKTCIKDMSALTFRQILTCNPKISGSLGLPLGIGGAAGVHASVGLDYVEDVKGHEAEAVSDSRSGAWKEVIGI